MCVCVWRNKERNSLINDPVTPLCTAITPPASPASTFINLLLRADDFRLWTFAWRVHSSATSQQTDKGSYLRICSLDGQRWCHLMPSSSIAVQQKIKTPESLITVGVGSRGWSTSIASSCCIMMCSYRGSRAPTGKTLLLKGVWCAMLMRRCNVHCSTVD